MGLRRRLSSPTSGPEGTAQGRTRPRHVSALEGLEGRTADQVISTDVEEEIPNEDRFLHPTLGCFRCWIDVRPENGFAVRGRRRVATVGDEAGELDIRDWLRKPQGDGKQEVQTENMAMQGLARWITLAHSTWMSIHMGCNTRTSWKGCTRVTRATSHWSMIVMGRGSPWIP